MPFRGNDENELLWNVCYEQIHYPMFLTRELTTLLQLVSSNRRTWRRLEAAPTFLLYLSNQSNDLQLLEREPLKRMGMSTCKSGDIKDQPWFAGVNWSDMEELRVNPPFVPEVVSIWLKLLPLSNQANPLIRNSLPFAELQTRRAELRRRLYAICAGIVAG